MRSTKQVSMVTLAIARAEAQTGRRLNGDSPMNALAGVQVIAVKQKFPQWTEAEDQFLRDNLGRMTDEEIGEKLGRSAIAVHLRWSRDLYLPSPSKDQNILTATNAAKMLGVDGHKISYWVDCGMIPGRMMAGGRKIRLIQRVTFLRWALTPDNWVWFDIHKVADPKLARLIQLRAQRWNDEWWTTRQVADHHGVHTGEVKRYIKLGYLEAHRLTESLGGRDHDRYWSNWRVKRSNALKIKFVDHMGISKTFTPRADAWLLKARDELGMPFNDIGRTMKIGEPGVGRINKVIVYRYHKLKIMMKQKGKGKRK